MSPSSRPMPTQRHLGGHHDSKAFSVRPNATSYLSPTSAVKSGIFLPFKYRLPSAALSLRACPFLQSRILGSLVINNIELPRNIVTSSFPSPSLSPISLCIGYRSPGCGTCMSSNRVGETLRGDENIGTAATMKKNTAFWGYNSLIRNKDIMLQVPSLPVGPFCGVSYRQQRIRLCRWDHGATAVHWLVYLCATTAVVETVVDAIECHSSGRRSVGKHLLKPLHSIFDYLLMTANLGVGQTII